jgi:hypothetical protein
MPRIVVSGALANRPHNGGGAWVRLNWILSLQRLGFDVFFLEEIGRDVCVDPSGTVVDLADSINLAFFRHVTEMFGLSSCSALVYECGQQVYGPAFRSLLERAEATELLINLSGHLTQPALLDRFRCKAYIDLDPGFTQLWHAQGNPGARLAGHDFYFTVGANIGQPDCPIPTGGFSWQPIRPPVVLDQWPVTAAPADGKFTTVATWRGPFGPLDFAGKTLGLKVQEFRKFIELPERVRQSFEIALRIHPAEEKDQRGLRSHGWHLVDPSVVAADPVAFRRYLQGSLAEFSAAQGVYVETQSGWFSDRTAAYLASGRPALIQDTGLGRTYPVGEGLIPFRTFNQAVAGAERIAGDYERHSRAARRLAETYFDSDGVLRELLLPIGLTS